MTPQQLAVLRANLIANGLLAATASDDDVVKAATSMQQSNPDQLAQMMSTGMPWLLIGAGVAALVAWYLWSNSKTKKLGEVEYEDSEPDNRHRLRGFSKSLGRLGSTSNCRQSMGRRSLGRSRGLGGDYEFEPEIRLEGHRGARRGRGARR